MRPAKPIGSVFDEVSAPRASGDEYRINRSDTCLHPTTALASTPALDHFAGETPWVAARIGRLRRVKQVGSRGIQTRLGAAPRILGTGADLLVEHLSSLGPHPRIDGRPNGGAKKKMAPQHHEAESGFPIRLLPTPTLVAQWASDREFGPELSRYAVVRS